MSTRRRGERKKATKKNSLYAQATVKAQHAAFATRLIERDRCLAIVKRLRERVNPTLGGTGDQEPWVEALALIDPLSAATTDPFLDGILASLPKENVVTFSGAEATVERRLESQMRTVVHYLTQGGKYGEEGEAEAAVEWIIDEAVARIDRRLRAGEEP